MASSLVLVADDDPTIRGILSRALKDNGLSTVEARDGAEALDIMRAITVDLVIVDIHMPRMNGLSLCRAIRERLDDSCVPLFVISGNVPPGAETDLLAVGVDDFMSKPFLYDELLARVMAALRRSRAS